MKKIISIIVLGIFALQLTAQVPQERKPSTLAFHVFYNDFNTAQQIKATSLGSVLKNGQWSKIGDMQTGFGMNYLKGIRNKIDFVATLDGSWTDYLYEDGTSYGSNQFLLDANAALNFKMLTDRHTFVPYISSGVGVSLYQGKTGFYVPVGAGLQFNVFNEAFIFTNMQYKVALTSSVNDHLYYSIGVGTSLPTKKKKQQVIEQKVVNPISDTSPTIAKLLVKNILVTVIDEQTGLPLPEVEVILLGSEGRKISFTNTNGQVIFDAVNAADYTVNGMLNGINTTSQNISIINFEVPGKQINISIFHNDPRFTLAGSVYNKNTHLPEGGVTINVVNDTQGSSISEQNQLVDGTFKIQLMADSYFTISGKKASYFSNIEKVSTKGLNRSSTLYVNLALNIEEVIRDKTIVLKNINYDKGSSMFRSDALSDLEKLVKFLNDNPDLSIEIESHTDSQGSNASNLILSKARAQEVVNYLQKNGVNKNMLIPKGYGETILVNGCTNGVNCSEAQHEQNRRTEFKVIDN